MGVRVLECRTKRRAQAGVCEKGADLQQRDARRRVGAGESVDDRRDIELPAFADAVGQRLKNIAHVGARGFVFRLRQQLHQRGDVRAIGEQFHRSQRRAAR